VYACLCVCYNLFLLHKLPVAIFRDPSSLDHKQRNRFDDDCCRAHRIDCTQAHLVRAVLLPKELLCVDRVCNGLLYRGLWIGLWRCFPLCVRVCMCAYLCDCACMRACKHVQKLLICTLDSHLESTCDSLHAHQCAYASTTDQLSRLAPSPLWVIPLGPSFVALALVEILLVLALAEAFPVAAPAAHCCSAFYASCGEFLKERHLAVEVEGTAKGPAR